MDHSPSSSSSSSMDDASMDDSDREHSYDYEIDEPDEDDDDEPHGGFDDVPDDDDDDDDMDDDDDDDDDDDEDNAVFVEPMIAPSHSSDPLSTSLSNALLELNAMRGRPDLPFLTPGLSAHPGLHPHGLDHFLGESPLVTIPSRQAIQAAAAASLQHRGNLRRSVLLETFDGNGRLTAHEPYRHSESSFAALSACLRGGFSALQPSRYWSSDGDFSSPFAGIHPMLCRPPTVSSSDVAEAAASLYSSLRHNHASDSPDPGAAAVSRLANRDSSAINPRFRIAQSFQSIRQALGVLDCADVSVPSASALPVADTQVEPDCTPASAPTALAPAVPATSTPTTSDVAAATSLATLRRSGDISGSSGIAGPSSAGRSADLPEHNCDEITARLESAVERHADRGQSQQLNELAEQDLMRSVDPVGMRTSMENMLSLISRHRDPYERMANRDRDREKISSGILKRWAYDPPSCGGDSLPAIFDSDYSHRNGRQSTRLTSTSPAQPLIAAESHEAVNQLSVKLVSRLDVLLADMMKVDMKVSDEENREKAKEAEDKKKKGEEEKLETAPKAVGSGSSSSAGPLTTAAENALPASSSAGSRPVLVPRDGTRQGGRDVEVREGWSEVLGRLNEALELSNDDPALPPQLEAATVGSGSAQVVPADEVTADAIMSAADVGPSPTNGSGEDTRPDIEAPATGVDVGEGGVTNARVPGSASPPAPNDFAAVAAQRAAAAGISLDAPANENPEVVAAATESTGIDPAFLAALPEEMRAEILTQYYEQIHTNANDGNGAAASPSATTVNQDFLVALPPALRSEVLALEAQFQSRQQNTTGAAGESGNENVSGANDREAGPGGVAGAEMDNATFLATLAPDLREEILLTSGEAFIQSLPPNFVAEARVLREREAVSRFPWRVSGEFPVGFDARRYPNGLRGPGLGQGRQPSRNQPREAPRYQWKKVENGWLREVPKAADEPRPSLKANGLFSLIRLLWLKQGHYGKTLLYQVLSHACKSTDSRLLVLQQLIQLILGNSLEQSLPTSSTQKNSDNELSRHHGTAVRRALELLTLLCKNDAVVAETLLGLPSSVKDLASVPSMIDDESVLPRIDSEISLSSLMSLLDTPLFVRSNSHLEQLVSLINALCLALPSTLTDESDRRNGSRSNARRRRMPVRSTALTPDFHESMNFLLVDADSDVVGEPPAVFHFADDGVGDDDDEESDDDPIERAATLRVERGSDARQSTATDINKAEAVAIPAQYRIPGFKQEDLVALTRVLVRQGCSDRTYDKISRCIGVLGELVPIRITFVDSLVSIAVKSGQGIHTEYQKVLSEIGESSVPSSKPQRSAVVTAFSVASASSELTLLRVVKSLSALWKHEAEENAGEEIEEVEKAEKGKKSTEAAEKDSSDGKDSEKMSPNSMEVSRQQCISTEQRFRPSMLTGLQGLWSSLDKLLELVADEIGIKDKKDTQRPRSSAPSAREVLNIDRMKSANRSLSPVLARLSPMIEAFLVTHSEEEPRRQQEAKVPDSPRTPLSSRDESSPGAGPASTFSMDLENAGFAKGMDGLLAVFVERHRGPINALLRANPSLLESSFKGALRHPHAIDFDNKKAYFRNVIRRRSSEAHAGTIRINVRRDRVFDDSYHQLRMRTPDEMKGRLHVQFTGEEGVDAGGVTREWYIILARQIFDPNYVLFTRSAAKAATYQPDKRSYINREHLENFKFVGRIIGKAIYDGQLLDAYFTRSFYKHILRLKPTYHDIEAQDPEYYKSLKWMLENDITGILDYTMSAEYDEFGKQTIVDLMPNGRNIPVTEENKGDFVRLVTEVRMTKTIEKQTEAFKEGFYQLIPHDDCKIFNELELELLMSGLPDIDMADLKANVEYTGYTASSPQVNWFWRCVGKMDQEDLARLVMFVTGTSKVPLEGFSMLQGMNGIQKFQIHRVAGNTMRLPSAHTCFNQLDLPEYSTAEILSERLLRAVRECSVGFGFA